MEMNPVTSSNLSAIGYDVEKKTMRVEFKNGSAYDYFDVPEHAYHEFKASDSVGKHFASRVRGAYQWVKVTQG